jgi:hypothetical protein
MQPKLLCRFLCALALVVAARASVITNVTVREVSSEYAPDRRHATNLVNGVGLFGEIHTPLPGGTMWLTQLDAAGAVVQAYVVFDLGATYTLNKLKVWNYNEQASGANILTRRGVASADILVAGEDEVFTTAKAAQAFTRAPGVFTNFFDLIDMGGVQARYVRINVLTNFGGDNRVGLSEVQFIANSIAPDVRAANRSFSGDRVIVQFSEAMDPASATNTANYSITGPSGVVAISSADFHFYKDAVVLRPASALKTNEVYTLGVQNVADANNSGTVGNEVLTILSDLAVWLKADQGVTAEGGLVSVWADQTGGNDAVQPDPAFQPTLVENAVANKPAVHFNGVDQVLEIPYADSIVMDRDITLYLVLSFDFANTYRYHGPIGINNGNIPASFDLYVDRGNPIGNNPKFTFLRGNGSGNQAFASQTGPQPNQFYVYSLVMRGTNATTYLNGSFNGTANILQGLWTVGNAIRLGMRQDGVTRFEGNLAEAMIFRGAVSDAERSTIDNYLGTKYGINVVALQITQQPEGATIEAGQRATFAVRVVAGTPTVNYQWQSNNVNIAGATNSYYTTPFLTKTPDTINYRVVVSTPLGVTANSSNATVTVGADTTAVTLASATRSTDESQVVVTFSEPVATGATQGSNYTLDRGATVSSAAVGSAPNQILLTVSGLTTDVHYLSVQGVQDFGGNTIAPVSVAVLPSGVALWVRADAGVQLESGAVRRWADQGPNGNDALQFNASARPALTAASINGKPTVTFSGAQFLEAFSNPSLVLTGDVSIFAVVNAADYGGFRGIVAKTAGNQPAPLDYYLVQGSGLPRVYRGNGAGLNAQTTGSVAPVPGEPHVVSVVQQGASVTHYLDGAENGTAALSTTMADAGTPLRIGNRDDLAVPFAGEIAEILIVNGGVSADERQAIDSYLGIKFFPFSIVEQPQPVTRQEGQTATFSVNARAGGAVFNYQWQRNNGDIAGANGASYTTPTLTLANNNDTYRVIISGPSLAPVTSDAATLTVVPDQEAPTVVSVGRSISDPSQIIVVFSEPVTVQTSDFTINNGATVTSATAGAGAAANEVTLTTTGLTPGGAFDLTIQNVKDLFNNTIATVTTTVRVHPASLALWLRADAGVTKDAQNFVIAWNDQSGNENNVSSVALDNSPLFTTNVWDELPSVLFDGVDDYMVAPSSATLAIVGDMTVYVVAQFDSFDGFHGLVGKTAGADNNMPAPFDYYLTPAGIPTFLRGDGAVSAGVPAQTSVAAGQPHILSVTMQGTAVKHYLDTAPNGSGVINTTVDDAGTGFALGTRGDLFTKMNGEIHEILVFASALSDRERAEIDEYLARKYGAANPTGPELSVAVGGGNVQLSWTQTAGFVLQHNSNISNAAGWTEVTAPVVSANGVNTVSVIIGSGNDFFRLIKP